MSLVMEVNSDGATAIKIRCVYNYFRDYDPAIGRYVESDPIGLKDGPSTYLYGHAAPNLVSDSLGLAVTGEWTKPPRINVTGVGIDGFAGFSSPTWSWLGYLEFIRLNGHANGYINIDVKCKDDCKTWEILNRAGFPGDFNLREDGVYGNSKAVFEVSTGASGTASSGEPGRARFAVGGGGVGGGEDGLRGADPASLGGTG